MLVVRTGRLPCGGEDWECVRLECGFVDAEMLDVSIQEIVLLTQENNNQSNSSSE